MPELPEVQTIVDDLNRKVRGAVIFDFWTEWKKGIKMDLPRFKKAVIGKKIFEVKRRGKNLIFYLSGDLVMHVHLKMTGHLLIKSGSDKEGHFNDKVNQYIRHKWLLKKGGKKFEMDFSDLRKFGKIRLMDRMEYAHDTELNALGIEPLSEEFSLKKFKEILKKKSRWALRDILMDQRIIAGIGNIYASEIMFEAGILPKRKAADLREDEVKKVFKEIKLVLQKAVKLRGTSDSDYRDTDGAKGGFQEVLKVYNREGRACQRKKCRGVVKREKHKQRSAFFCESCQA